MAARTVVDPQGLARVARMELIARQAVEGFLSGRHPSPYYGSSVEYADHRPYTIGDEIRSIDWKLLAKTDRYFIKQFEEQTNARCNLLLDASASMSYGSGPVRKIDYACLLAAALGYLMLRQSDAVGLTLFDNQVRQYLPARSNPSHFRLMLDLLAQHQPRGDTAVGPVLHQIAGRLKRRGLVIVISDLIDDSEAIRSGLAHFRHDHHEVIVFHVMDPAELTFPFERLTRFKDLEGGGTLVANPHHIRARYLERLETFIKSVKTGCFERDISYQLASTDVPYDRLLSAYLEKRSRMK